MSKSFLNELTGQFVLKFTGLTFRDKQISIAVSSIFFQLGINSPLSQSCSFGNNRQYHSVQEFKHQNGWRYYRLASINIILIYMLTMNNEHYQQKLALLDQYAHCLQRENQAKTKEIAVLHQHLSHINRQNDSLRTALHDVIEKLEVRQKERNVNCSLQTSLNLRELPNVSSISDACCQTEDDHEEQYRNQIDQILNLNQLIREKDEIIEKYQREGEEMFEAIEKLEKKTTSFSQRHNADKERINRLEQQLKLEEKKKLAVEQQLKEASYTKHHAGEASESFKRQYHSLEQELSRLVSENNGLIERVRALEREKNEYYHELKRMSRVSFGTQNLSKSALKRDTKVKDQRWKDIEANLRKLQIENEAIQSNLMIKY